MKNRKICILIPALLVLCMILSACGNSRASQASTESAEELPQSIGTPSIVNARDLGGYKNANGKNVKSGILIRTANLSKATTEDLVKLSETYKVRAIVDLRDQSEIDKAPDPEITGAAHYHFPTFPQLSGDSELAESKDSIQEDYTADREFTSLNLIYVRDHGYDISAHVTSSYKQSATAENSIAGYKQFFDILLEDEDGAVLWHCSSGKDRTGIAALLILTALDVDQETIMNDYLLTNTYRADTTAAAVAEAAKETDDEYLLEQVRLANDVDRAYMESFIKTVEANYGSLENFLTEKMELTTEKKQALKDKYLE